MPSDVKPIELTAAELSSARRRADLASAEAEWRGRLAEMRADKLKARVSIAADRRGLPLTKRQAREVAERAGEWAEGVVKGLKRGGAF